MMIKGYLWLPVVVFVASFCDIEGRVGSLRTTRNVRPLPYTGDSRIGNSNIHKPRKLMGSSKEAGTRRGRSLEISDWNENPEGHGDSNSTSYDGNSNSTSGDGYNLYNYTFGKMSGSKKSMSMSKSKGKSSTLEPTYFPSEAPTTPEPTVTPGSPTPLPTPRPPTKLPTNAPTTAMETPEPTVAPTRSTPMPTKDGETPAPSDFSATEAPTEDSATPAPTSSTPGPTVDFATTPAPTSQVGSTPAPTGSTGTTPAPSPFTTPTPTITRTCNDNPKDYDVTLDIQIKFPNDEIVTCDSEEQERAINANIQAALNENFPTTVPDWEGDAFFGTFFFDPDQEINNLESRRGRNLALSFGRNLQQATCNERNVECDGDLCRWGCLTASTTDCGTSALTNWVHLGEDVRERLAGLGFGCLGAADELKVVLRVVDDDDSRPPSPSETPAPSVMMATPAPTMITIFPTSVGGPRPPFDTPAPSSSTPGPTVDFSTPAPTTSFSTPVPTEGGFPAPPGSCMDNPQEYVVNLDIQIEFPNDEFAACDSEEQESAITANIQAALNENFATSVPDWEGDVYFGEFVFDPDQEINNLEESVTRRILKNSHVSWRNLQEGTCCQRTVECEGDLCRWGCLTADTTDCGTSALTSWNRLADDVRDRLAGLGFDCLGNPDELEVVLRVVEDPDSCGPTGTPAPTMLGATPAPTPAPSATTPAPSASTPAPSGSTPAPSATTPAPSSITPAPSGSTSAPTMDTPVPTVSATGTLAPTTGGTLSPSTSVTTAPTPNFTCTDNPQDYVVNLDLQIDFDGDSVTCTGEEDSSIASVIQAALNENFPITVPDWDGDVYFGEFVFDPSQDVDNTSARRILINQWSPGRVLQQGTCNERSVSCDADFCRWGCTTAMTTDCGTSVLTNWVLLAEDVQEELAGLGFACLGVPDELEVKLVVEDGQFGTPSPTTAPAPTTEPGDTPAPTVIASTPAPTVSVSTSGPTSATLAPTGVGSTPAPTEPIATEIPTSLATPAPTGSIATVIPTALATTAPTGSIATVIPTALATTAPTGSIATVIPTALATPAPTGSVATESPTSSTTVGPTLVTTAPPTASVTMAPTPNFTCTDNPQDYAVNVDLQINFPGDKITCTSEEDVSISSNIQDALNENFATTVPDWDGDAFFGPFTFDPNQEADGANRIAGRRLISESEIVGRSLQQGTCSERFVDCDGDFCRWGCTTASTTDCGTSSLTNWFLLADDIHERLAGLGYDCLGDPDALDVILVVEDPEASTVRTSSAGGNEKEGDTGKVGGGGLSNFDPNPNSVLLDTVEGSGGDQVADRPTHTIQFESRLKVRFFAGHEDVPSEEDIQALIPKLVAFLNARIKKDPDYANDFVQYSISGVSHQYLRDANTNKDTFQMDFISNVRLAEESPRTTKETCKSLTEYDFKYFIRDYAWKSAPYKENQFYNTEWVKFVTKGKQCFK